MRSSINQPEDIAICIKKMRQYLDIAQEIMGSDTYSFYQTKGALHLLKAVYQAKLNKDSSKQLEEAINYLKKALAGIPTKHYTFPPICWHLGRSYLAKGILLIKRGHDPLEAFDLGIKYLKRSLKHFSDLYSHYLIAKLYFYKGTYLIDSGKGLRRYLDQALHHLDNVLKADPDMLEVYLYKGMTLYMIGKWFAKGDERKDLLLEAIDSLSKELSKGLNPARILFFRGSSYYELGRYKEAIDDWERVIKIEPGRRSEIMPLIREAKRGLKRKQPPTE
jgi:tetratricopeptide (TPR) repeat protein